MVIPIDPCETCGGDPATCDCGDRYFPSRDQYDDLVHGPGGPPERHCDLCGAVRRYCPGHLHDVELLSLRGGVKRMMPIVDPVDCVQSPRGSQASGNVGYFIGDPVAIWSPDGERMILEKEFAYVDPRAKRWSAPRGAVLDGASIPGPFWMFVGSPYRGRYRYASIVHDYHCNARIEAWGSVHLCFYYACLAGGTGRIQSKLMYYAVYHFGPRWGYRAAIGYVPVAMGRTPELPMVKLERIERFIVEDDPSLDEIRAVEPAELGITFRNS